MAKILTSDFDGYYIVWLNANGKEIGDEWFNAPTYEKAVAKAALRLRQSPHLCPANVGGFYIEYLVDWRKRHGKEPHKLRELFRGENSGRWD
jgi:hypothetical protein